MSGQHPPPSPGGGRGWSPHSNRSVPTPPPFGYRPQSPYAASPPPRLMGSPMFHGQLPHMPCPRPRWPSPLPSGMQSPIPRGPRPFMPMQPPSMMCPSPEVFYHGITPYVDVGPPSRDFEYVGVPIEPPGSPYTPNMFVDKDTSSSGLSTADIIANQSQDYVDEKLAEYQATIQQLQDIYLK